jgi:lipoprotein-anchoring transpeptidase ErfK/SrfK
MTRQPSHAELHNVRPAGPAILQQGDSSRQVKQLQARLKQLDWFAENVTGYYGPVTTAAVKGFQDKRGLPTTGAVDQATWDRLVAMTHEPTAAELSGSDAGAIATGNLDQRCLTGRAMCIDKTTNQLVWVIDGKPQLRFDVRFGADTSPTREGAFNVGWKARDWVSTIYHSAMPYSMFFSGGQAVHYSADFAARGYAGASHGCVNVRDLAGLQNLYAQVKVGDKVIVYRS